MDLIKAQEKSGRADAQGTHAVAAIYLVPQAAGTSAEVTGPLPAGRGEVRAGAAEDPGDAALEPRAEPGLPEPERVRDAVPLDALVKPPPLRVGLHVSCPRSPSIHAALLSPENRE